MGLIEDIVANGVSQGVQDATNKMVAGNATNETVESVNTILTTTIPWDNPADDLSFALFLITTILMLLYYIMISYFKRQVAEEVKAKYLSLRNKGSRGPGAVLIIFGDTLFIMANMVVIAMVVTLSTGVFLNTIFPSTLMLLGLGLLGIPLLVILGIAVIILLISFYIYAIYLTAGLVTIRTLGLALFFDPNNVLAKKLLRLFFANLLFPLSLILLLWFTQLVALIFVFPIIMMPIAPVFVGVWSLVLLYVIHTLAWDWDIGTSYGRYRRNTVWVLRKAGLVAAASTGNPAVIGAATAANAATSGQPDDKTKPGIKKR